MPDLYLRPCPFCGRSNVEICLIYIGAIETHFVACRDCYTAGPKSFVSATQAAGLWNRRACAKDDAGAAYRVREDTDPRHYREMDKLVDKFFREKGEAK